MCIVKSAIFPWSNLSAIITYLHSRQEKNWENMTFCNQLKITNTLLKKGLIFPLVYIFPWKLHISLKVYFFMWRSVEKMVKTSKFVSQNWSQTIKTNSIILTWDDCNFCFFLLQQSNKLQRIQLV